MDGSWPLPTNLPFLGEYAKAMFLKATVALDLRCGWVTRAATARPPSGVPRPVGRYPLAAMTKLASTALRPRDDLDVRSFVGPVGKYRPGDEVE